jgi:ATP-binding cassette subfamily C protein
MSFHVRGLVLSTFVFSVVSNLLMLTGPLFMLQVYDRVLSSRSEETLLALSILVSGLYLAYWLIDYARGRVISRVGPRLQAALNPAVFAAHVRGPEGGASPLQDVEAVRALFAAPVILTVFDAPWTPLFLAFIFVFHPVLGWCAIAGGAILVLAAFLNEVLTRRRMSRAARVTNEANGFAQEVAGNRDFVMAQGLLGTLSRRWEDRQSRAMALSMGASDWTGLFSSFIRAFRLFLQSAMLAVAALLVLKGELTPGAMIASSILLGRALAPIEAGVSQWQMIQRALAGWRTLRKLMRAEREAAPREVTELPRPDAQLALRDVALMLPGGQRPVLTGLTFAIAPGEAVGVLGRSGSGKSCLARAMVGLLPPVRGDIRLGGARIDHYGPDAFGRHVGYLPQEPEFFAGTVAENIARMQERPDAAQVVAAARKAMVHDVILSLPDGYDTVIGHGMTSLSGGQKQRLALARALYGDPVLLVLDEPNSALDAEGSDALNAAVAALKAEGRAVVIMTHRPAAIGACDKLVVLEGGQMAGFGPRDQIIRSMIKNADDVQRVAARSARAE